jgi:hypothetical protein
MKSVLGVGLLVLLAGCAGSMAPPVNSGHPFARPGTHPGTTTDFRVTIEQKSASMSMATAADNNAPVAPVDIDYAIAITNKTKDAVTVRHITLLYRDPERAIPRRTRNYEMTIPPGTTGKVDDFWLQMRANDAGPGPMPASLRADIEFEGPQGKRLESFLCYVSRPGR